MKNKVAIIGGGIAGLTAAYLLQGEYDITLFEKEDRIGGNAYTLKTSDGNEIDISVFFYAKKSYQNFFNLLHDIGIKIRMGPFTDLSMTMHNLDTDDDDYFNPRGIITTLKLSDFVIVKDLINSLINTKRGLRLFRKGEFKGLTTQEGLKFLPGLKGNALKLVFFPICLASSMYYEELMNAPVEYFFNKLQIYFNSLRKIFGWSLIDCRSRVYINRLADYYQDKIILGSKIRSVVRTDKKVILKMDGGSELEFDKVILACNADQALSLLASPTDAEKKLLGAWKYKEGLVVVHKDSSFFPRKELRSLYNFLYIERGDQVQTSINTCYCFQKGVSDNCEYLGTQHPNFPIDDNLIEFKKVFRTPIYDKRSVPAIEGLHALNGKNNTYFCGSHFGYGLHEDAVTSAINVANMLLPDRQK